MIQPAIAGGTKCANFRCSSHCRRIALDRHAELWLDGNVLHFEGADVLDGTPLLDIKPYTAKFDHIESRMRNGWQDEVDEETAQQRGRRGK